MSKTPRQKPGRSRQDYGTPDDFYRACVREWGPFLVDLAATAKNTMCSDWLGPESPIAEDSLTEVWPKVLRNGTGWLNPPFGNLRPWAAKCREGGRIVMLTPSSLGAEWYCDEVQGHALTLVVRPRLTFTGETTPYPKDCAVHLFGFGMVGLGTWRWQP